MQTSLNFTKNLPYIILLCLGGTFFTFMAFMLLPTVLLFPQKFSFSFALGCMCYMGAIALIRDPKTFLLSLLQKDKILFTVVYVISLLGTFYFSLIAKSYIFALFFCIAQVNYQQHIESLKKILQIVSLLWLIGSSIPGGTKFLGMFQSAVFSCLKATGKRLISGSNGSKSFLPI